MSKTIRIKKGLDIKLKGKADKIYMRAERASSYAVKPTDFHGIMPKLLAKPGDKVNVGSPLFYDKYNSRVKFTSPVSGEVKFINRGERRKILEVVIQPDEKDEFVDFKTGKTESLKREDVVDTLLESGMWPVIRQRPYSVIPNPETSPRDIFISGFDSAPLAADVDFIVKDSKEEFQAGIDILQKLTDGDIYLGINAEYPPCKTYAEVKGVKQFSFSGPHPAGNVGIQIHHIKPINKGEVVWYVRPQDVIRIGNLFRNGKLDNSTVIALAGSEVIKPVYYKLTIGSSIIPVIEGKLKEGELRYISGDVLTGTKIVKDGYLGFYDNLITVIPEGKYFEFFGWASPGFGKYSISRSFWSWLRPNKRYRLDTNLKGGRRAYVMTGEYEKVLPMNIYPVQLIKSILIEDIDKMEKLGIYEVAEEDLALCEFVCTSKTEVQEIVRRGLDLMKKETE